MNWVAIFNIIHHMYTTKWIKDRPYIFPLIFGGGWIMHFYRYHDFTSRLDNIVDRSRTKLRQMQQQQVKFYKEELKHLKREPGALKLRPTTHPFSQRAVISRDKNNLNIKLSIHPDQKVPIYVAVYDKESSGEELPTRLTVLGRLSKGQPIPIDCDLEGKYLVLEDLIGRILSGTYVTQSTLSG